MSDLVLALVAVVAGVLVGYAICAFATWNRVHQQESHLRALVTDIHVMLDMHDDVPPEWMLDRLDQMIATDYR